MGRTAQHMVVTFMPAVWWRLILTQLEGTIEGGTHSNREAATRRKP